LLEAPAPCAEYHSVALVASGLRERNRNCSASCHFLPRHGATAVKVLADSLQSDDARARQRGKALESSPPPRPRS
jgi:hypothetical protein